MEETKNKRRDFLLNNDNLYYNVIYLAWPFIITFVSWILIRITLAYILAFVFNLQSTGVWIAISLSSIISGVLSYIVFKKGRWKYVKIHKVKNAE